MTQGLDPILLIYILSALLSGALAVILWQHHGKTGVIPLLGTVLAVGLWDVSLVLLSVIGHPLATTVLTGTLFLGVGFATMTFLVFTLVYTGREQFLTTPILAVLSAEPILLAVLAVVNPSHLFFESFNGTLEPGPLLWIHLGYAYLVLGLVTVLILGFLYRSRSLYKGQSAALLFGTLATWIANGVYVAGFVEFDTSPIGFVVAGSLYAVAIVRYRLADVVPIARDRVIDTVTDGVFVIDTDDRIIDINPAARDLFEGADSSVIGTDVHSLIAGYPVLEEQYDEITTAPVESEREFSLGTVAYHVRSTPIEDSRDRHVGWLLIIRDITERKRHEERLEQQNDRLEQFANIVSHDLRNPLNVADGYLDLAREADDPAQYFDEIDRSHDRMETIIEDVLALAREGSAVTDPEPVSLADLAEQAWESVDTGDATLSVTSDLTILADPKRITRLFENLFRNSVEHGTPDATDDGADPIGSPLEVEVGTIGADDGGGSVGFYVSDDGLGLPDEGEDVFEDGYTTNAEGTGFGLSIVQGIATAHGWTVTAGEGERGGARFDFTGVDSDGANESSADGSVGTLGSPVPASDGQPSDTTPS
ncbi:PAS domain-containing sensor histidine kinase [Natrinema sp. CBA1119]|uniref:sensor histidine kinase n=1 Tax=Natrinema sp. CBA1119 TaxID=1608465 RepID=UPI000BF75128|nr:histidine kinase N-terminal 7TM domain-containing protein [Natrinema sp. CBA1119]PGF17928.1 PAS domain-containing sensor histidine kinase [Natrinema sp. CBA1119]